MAAPVLLRQVLLLHRVRFHNLKRFAAAGALPPPQRLWCSAAPNPQSDQADEKLNSVVSSSSSSTSVRTAKEHSSYRRWEEDPDYRKWKNKEEEILRDIQPIVLLTKDILHSGRYMDGERLTVEDERAVVEKLLSYHPHSEDKIGCGLESIMVDRHPQFRHSRCLFVVRTDGGWIDFSYQKCLREYIRDKYPNHAERFIREHFKRGSD